MFSFNINFQITQVKLHNNEYKGISWYELITNVTLYVKKKHNVPIDDYHENYVQCPEGM